MRRGPPRTTRTDTPFPYTTLCRSEGLVDLDAARPLGSGLDELLAHLAEVDLAAAADESGVGLDDIRRMALTIGRAERCLVAWSMGVNHSAQGTETVTLLNTLCVLTGNIGRPGAAPFSITGQCNAMGTRATGFTARSAARRVGHERVSTCRSRGSPRHKTKKNNKI